MKEKPKIGKAVLFSIVGIVAYYICLFVLTLIVGFLFALLLNLPVIKHIVAFIFKTRGDTPDFFTVLLAVVLSYNAVVWMVSRFCDSKATEYLTLIVIGIVLLLSNILFLVINVINHSGIIGNILSGIAAVIMILRGVQIKNDL